MGIPEKPVERYAALKDMAAFLSSMPKEEVDRIIRLVNGAIVMDSDNSKLHDKWDSLPESKRSKAIMGAFDYMTDESLDDLWEFMPGADSLGENGLAGASAIGVEGEMSDGSIFVVHGHASAIRHEIVRVLERGTGRDVIVLHEQVNAGRTILEKFEDYAGEAGFAVVLLTADDEGGKRSSTDTHLRGRQNVIFELGFFFGKLGRNRVVVILEEGVERPSDIDGLVYIDLDSVGAWKQGLARELEAGGISVDWARMP